MLKSTVILILLLLYSVVRAQDSPMGFASLDGGTTGGTGGDTIFVNSAQQLAEIMKPREKNVTDPFVIFISDMLTGFDDMIDIKRTANISLLGIEKNAGVAGFGVKLVESRNIIVRNLIFSDCIIEEKDGLTIDRCNNIWVDHCTFTDSPANDPAGNNHDGLLDVKKGSYNVTISHCYFNNHRKTALFGHSVKETGDANMKATYYHNWFDGTYSRHPRARYGKVHLLNNLYSNIGGYGVGVTCSAQVMLEGNYFENTSIPVLISGVNDPEETLSGDPPGFLKAVVNYRFNAGPIVENLDGYDFDPHDYYDYSVDDSPTVKSIVSENAGAGKIDLNTAIESGKPAQPAELKLRQNYPNPFNPETTIEFHLGKAGKTNLTIYNALGVEIMTLINQNLTAGIYQVTFRADKLPSGLYFYKIHTDDFSQVRKMIFLQ